MPRWRGAAMPRMPCRQGRKAGGEEHRSRGSDSAIKRARGEGGFWRAVSWVSAVVAGARLPP